MLLTAACGITYDYVTASKSSELVVSDPSTTWQFNKSSTIFEKAYILDIFSKKRTYAYKRTIQKSAFRKILDSVLVDDRIDFK